MISFGPVPSRRLGKSLGINNILAPKVCSYDCIYCQIGKTRKKCAERREFFKPEVIYEDVIRHLQQINSTAYPDYLTFVSNGEPTLDRNLGRSIQLLKSTGIPVAVLTNASLLPLKSVRDDLQLADWVSLKIDAADSHTRGIINRPVPGFTFDKFVESLQLFNSGYHGKLCTETMLVHGVNDSAKSLTGISKMIKKLEPFKAYLSIPVRPPAVKEIETPDPETLNLAWNIFNDNNIDTELMTGFEGTDTAFTGNIYEDILNMTAVHPLREDTLLNLLTNDNADFLVVKSLVSQRLIKPVIYNGYKYYLRDYHTNY